MNNDMIPVGTTVHINPEDIKWECNGDLISREALKKAIIEHRYDYVEDNFFWTKLFDIIDNAPTISPFKVIGDFIKSTNEGKGEEE